MAWFRRKKQDDDPTYAVVPGPAWTDALLVVLEVFKSGGDALPAALHEHVVTGGRPEVLGAIGTGPSQTGIFRAPYDPESAAARRVLWEGLDAMPIAVALRWCGVLEATLDPGTRTIDAPAGAPWLPALVRHLAESFPHTHVPVSHRSVERLLDGCGAPPEGLVAAAVVGPRGARRYESWLVRNDRTTVARMAGFADAVRRHASAVDHLDSLGVDGRVDMAIAISHGDDTGCRELAPIVASYATSTSKKVREAADRLVSRCGPAIVPPLRTLAADGAPEVRERALDLLVAHGAAEDLAWARTTASVDRAARVRALVERWDGPPTPDGAPPTHGDPQPVGDSALTPPTLPPLPPTVWEQPDTPALRELVDQLCGLVNQATDELNRSRRQWALGSGQSASPDLPGRPSATAAQLVAILTGGAPLTVLPPQQDHGWGNQSATQAITALLPHPAMSPPVLVTLLSFFAGLLDPSGRLQPGAVAALNELHDRTDRPTLIELATLLGDSDLDGPDLVTTACTVGWGALLGDGWSAGDVHDFVRTYPEELVARLARSDRSWDFHPESVLRLLRGVHIPARPTDTLFDLALGTRKTDRAAVQDLLSEHPDAMRRMTAALADGRGEVRAVAAGWIARRRLEEAVPALETAVRTEKLDLPKGTMLDALHQLGRPVAHYVDRADLLARALAAKAEPRDLGWFPWTGLPDVRWDDTGEMVPAVLVRWLVAQAARTKSPEPNAVLRHVCAMLRTPDRERLGQYVLMTWIAEDLRPIDADEALTLARDSALSWQRWHQTPQFRADSPFAGLSVEELTARFLPDFQRQPVGSATASKGVLALAAACAGVEAVAPAAGYVREWYGHRLAQSRALIGMLAWVDDPSAIQQVLAIGARFRTKSIQEEASAQIAALADRKGWSIAELGDRTIPTGGFDESGVLELDYGPRTFTAVLLPDLTIELRNPDGARVAALPTARQSDNDDLVKGAKKALTSARRELKSVIALQNDRLYEALCTGRVWERDDWTHYLAGHPVVGVLTRHLLWVVTAPDGAVAVFRQLDDGTLSGVDDETITLAEGSSIALAHGSLLDADDVAAWQRHLEDYEVVPLFDQLGKGVLRVPPADLDGRQISDRVGYLVEAFRLRSRATRLGWVRGPTGDGGWFSTYLKRFPTLGLTAEIEFTGNSLPEENRVVAMQSLSFHRSDGTGSWGSTGMRLGDIPEILVSETWNDLRLIASDGTGFDPDWESVATR